MPDGRTRATAPTRDASWSVAAAAVIIIGGILRLARLDLIEFKGDEQEALNLGIRLLENPPWTAAGALPQHGMPSSQGIANAPLFNWIMAAAWAVTGHPSGATALVGLANALALYPLWRWAMRWMDRERALLLLAIVAVSPFTVLLSRKLWAQDLLFPALVCLLWAVEYWRTRQVFRAIAWFAIAALPIGQLHQSGPIALAVFPIAVAADAMRDRAGFLDRIRDLARFSPAQYGLLLLLMVAHGLFWIPYLEYLWSLPSVFANRLRLDHYEPALLRMVGQQVAPLDLFYFFAPDRSEFLASGWRRFVYSLTVAFGSGLLIVGLLGWIRSPNRLPIIGIWWGLVIAIFMAARIPAYPFYALILAPLPAALAAGAFDGPLLPSAVARTVLLARWTYVVALLALTVTTGAWFADRGGARGDYGIVYGVREQQARALASQPTLSGDSTRLRCQEPPGEVLWIVEHVLRTQVHDASLAVCDGWLHEDGRDRYRWSVRR